MRSPLSFALAVALVPFSGPAEAQPSPEVHQADARFDEGTELAARGQWNEARVAFLQAYAVHPAPRMLWSLAAAECASGLPVECLRHLRRYANARDAEPEKLATLPHLVDDANLKTGHLRITAREVYVDGKAVPERAAPDEIVDVSPGPHEVRIVRSGRSERFAVMLQAGESIALPGWEAKGPAAPASAPAFAGSSRPARGRTAFLLGGAALTAGGAVVSTIVGVQYQSAQNDVEARAATSGCERGGAACAALARAVDDRNGAARVFNVAFPVTIGLGLATAIGYFLWPETWTTVAVGLGRGGSDAEVTLQGGF